MLLGAPSTMIVQSQASAMLLGMAYRFPADLGFQELYEGSSSSLTSNWLHALVTFTPS